MKNLITNLLAITVSLLLLQGCGQRKAQESFTVGTALIGTSDAVFELAADLAQNYQATYPTAFVSVYRHNTQALLDSLLSQKAEEVFLDRIVLPAESLAFADHGLKLYTYPACFYPVYLLVDSTLGVMALDSAEFRHILTGEATNWKQFGGLDQTITPYMPLPGTGGWMTITDYFGNPDSIVAVPCSTDAQMLELAAIDPGALLIYSHPLDDLDGYTRLRWKFGNLRIPPNVKTILDWPNYPFLMVFTYATTKNKIDVASGFLTWMSANSGQKLVMDAGYRPAAIPVRVIQQKIEPDTLDAQQDTLDVDKKAETAG